MRRIVTGLDANGKSTVLYDGPPQSIHHVTGGKVGALRLAHVTEFRDDLGPSEVCAVDIWETDGPPAPDAPDPMATPRDFTMEPPGSGLRVRYQAWAPDLDSSTMHATDTLDINVIVAGQVELLLEEGRSVTLHAGDSVVLPGIQHGWRAGPEGVTMLNIMQKLA